jgi:hypothetical protein
MNAVLSEIKKWNTKYLRKLENHTNALAVNLLDNSETTHTWSGYKITGLIFLPAPCCLGNSERGGILACPVPSVTPQALHYPCGMIMRIVAILISMQLCSFLSSTFGMGPNCHLDIRLWVFFLYLYLN